MELNETELKAMDSPFKRLFHKQVELRVFKQLGMDLKDQQVLEIGCGSGFGAELLMELEPRDYTGVDLMPVQVESAQQRNLSNARFMEMDAANLDAFEDETFDSVVIFRILHHMPEWRSTLKECNRVVRPGGRIFIVEPYKPLIEFSDLFLKWKHPKEALFSVREFRDRLHECGFSSREVHLFLGFAMCGRKPES